MPNVQRSTRKPSTILFLHGAGSNRDFWYEQRAAFPDAQFPNLPRHSGVDDRPQQSTSSIVHRPSSVEAYADWVAGYVEQEGLRGVVLNGHSMGGAIALTLALRKPTWLQALVLTGSGAKLRVAPRLLDLLRTDYPSAVDLIVGESFASGEEGSLTYIQRARLNGVRRQLLRTPREVTLGDYEACDRFDVMERAREIDLPILCIVGAQDTMTPPKYSEHLHRTIPGCRLEIIESAGHMLPLEQPETYNLRVGEFIQNVKRKT